MSDPTPTGVGLLQGALSRCPLVAILRGVEPDEAIAVAEGLVVAGFTIVEVPLNSPQPLASIRLLAARFGDAVLVGAGTVRTEAEVEAVARAGGRVIVMPHADTAIVRAARRLGLVAMPGFATPTEAFAAIDAGADALKLFPAELCPPAGLRAIRTVLPKDLPILPVGSITPERMADYWAAGARGFGLGSALYRAGDAPADVAARAQTFVQAARQLS